MTIHLSARLAWHDSGWNGRICNKPRLNVSCMVHEHIRDGKDEEKEWELMITALIDESIFIKSNS
ncbi:MAG TPA: hypothetical protein ENL09_01805 [Bacteroidetes bacterium]|nr:hypothetical protein [Bacteroidota bacterium]